MTSMKKILFPTDLTVGAEAAQVLAVSLARKHGAELLLFHAVLTHAHELRQFGALLTDFFGRLETEAERKLERETTELKERGVVARYEVVQAAAAFEAILERASSWAPDLIVMATHGRTGMPRWFLGNVAEKVVRHAACSVATLRPDEGPGKAGATERGLERTLVPVDFSDNSRRALELARSLAADGGSITVVHVVHNPTLAGLSASEHLRLFSEEPTLPDKIRGEMEEWMQGQPFDARVTEADDVATGILEVAKSEEADMIIVGARGQSAFEHYLTGSVAEKLVRTSPIPVITVK